MPFDPIRNTMTVSTIGDHIAYHMGVTLLCQPCDRSIKADLMGLAERYGSDMDMEDVKRRAVCRRCGRKGMQMLISGSSAPRARPPA